MKLINTYPNNKLLNIKYFQYEGFDEFMSYLDVDGNYPPVSMYDELEIDEVNKKLYYKPNSKTLILIEVGEWFVVKKSDSYPDYRSSCKIISNDEYMLLENLSEEFYPLAQELLTTATANVDWSKYSSDCDAYNCSCSDPTDHVYEDIRKAIELSIKRIYDNLTSR